LYFLLIGADESKGEWDEVYLGEFTRRIDDNFSAFERRAYKFIVIIISGILNLQHVIMVLLLKCMNTIKTRPSNRREFLESFEMLDF